MPVSGLLSRWDQPRVPASDVVKDRHSKGTTSLHTASSLATKTPSASFNRAVRDHSFYAPKATDGSTARGRSAMRRPPSPLTVVMSLIGTTRKSGNVRFYAPIGGRADINAPAASGLIY